MVGASPDTPCTGGHLLACDSPWLCSSCSEAFLPSSFFHRFLLLKPKPLPATCQVSTWYLGSTYLVAFTPCAELGPRCSPKHPERRMELLYCAPSGPWDRLISLHPFSSPAFIRIFPYSAAEMGFLSGVVLFLFPSHGRRSHVLKQVDEEPTRQWRSGV